MKRRALRRRGFALALWLRSRGDPLPTGRQWLASIPGGVLLFLASNGIASIASQTVSSAVVAVMSAATPLFAALIETLRGRRQRPGRVAGHGCAARRGQRAHAVIQLPGAALHHRGDGMLLAPIGLALQTDLGLSLAPCPRPDGAAAQMFTGGVAMLVVAILRGELLLVSFPAARNGVGRSISSSSACSSAFPPTPICCGIPAPPSP